MTLEQYKQWNNRYEEAMQSVNNREEEVAKVNDLMEVDLELIGSTAIEDKLQDGVPETIKYMRRAGIKVWVLTGDKIETAINIGYSSGLLDTNMEQILITETSDHQIMAQLEQGFKDYDKAKEEKLKTAVVVSGEALLHIFVN